MTTKKTAMQTVAELLEDAAWNDVQERNNFAIGVRKGLFVIILLLSGVFAVGTASARLEEFPGLDTVIKEAEVVAVIRVERSLNREEARIGALPYSAHECLIQCVLKGTVTTGRVSVIMLRPVGTLSAMAPVQVGGCYLVFMSRQLDSGNGAVYRSLDYPACVLPLGWGDKEQYRPTGSVKEDIKILLKAYLRWRDEFIQKETRGLNQMLGE